MYSGATTFHSTAIFINPYAIEVLQTKKTELVKGISNTEDLLNLLIDKGVFPQEKKMVVFHSRTREERNCRVLDILVSRGERACRIFFYPCLKLVEPDLYQSIKAFLGGINERVHDTRRQLIGYLLERERGPIKHEVVPKKTANIVIPQEDATFPRSEEKMITSLGGNVSGLNVGKKQTCDIFSAAAMGNLSVLENLLEDSAINKVSMSQETLLHIAAQHGQTSIVEFLISKGAQLDIKDGQGYTALHRAAEKGHISTVQTLIRAGADIYAVDKKYKTPLHLAAKNRHNSTIKAIVEEEIRHFKHQKTFLHMTATDDDVNLAQILLRCGAPVDARDNQKRTALFHAISQRSEKTARVLLEAGAQVDSVIIDAACNLNCQPIYSLLLDYIKGLTPNSVKAMLFKAVQRNMEGVVAALIENGTDPNIRNDQHYTPLLLAAELGNVETVRVLVTHNTSLAEKLPNSNSALHLAIQTGSLEITKLLLEKGLDANTAGFNEQTPLHLAALHNKPALVGTLLYAGAQVNAITKEGLTPLHVASQHNHKDTVLQLIKGKASVHTKDKHARTALHYAATQEDASAIQILLSSGADSNAADNEKRTPLHMAAMEGRSEAVSVLLAQKAQSRAKDMDGCTALHHAAANGNSKVAADLLSSVKNKNVDDKNVWRRTALHIASEQGHDNLIELLLFRGAKINAIDKNKDTPLHCASRIGHIRCVQRLVSFTQGEKVNLQATNNVKKTPLQVAESNDTQNHHQIVNLLKKKMFLIK